MTQNFWDAYWANFLGGISVIVILGLVGIITKHKIARNLKKFIAGQVDETLKQIKEINKL